MGSSGPCLHRVGDDADGQVRPWALGIFGLDYDQLSRPSPAFVLRVLRASRYRISWRLPVAVACPCAHVCILQRLDGSGFRSFGRRILTLYLSLP